MRVVSSTRTILAPTRNVWNASLRGGPSEAVHDLVHIEDVVAAVLRGGEPQGITGSFNVGTGQPTAVSDVV